MMELYTDVTQTFCVSENTGTHDVVSLKCVHSGSRVPELIDSATPSLILCGISRTKGHRERARDDGSDSRRQADTYFNLKQGR